MDTNDKPRGTVPPASGNITLTADLFAAALTDPAQRPRAHKHLQAFLASGGAPDLRVLAPSHAAPLLVAAAAHGWNEAVVDLLAAGADVNIDNDAALRSSATKGHLLIVQRLLAAGADIHAESDAALHRAVGNGHLPVVEALLAAGADVRSSGDMALRTATIYGYLAIVQRLLAAGADVHTGHDAPLHRAVQNDHLPIVECLLATGADVHAWGDLALRIAAINGYQPIVEHLLAAGASAIQAVAAYSTETKQAVCGALDAAAAIIPVDQRQGLIEMAPCLFPALCTLIAAEQRQPAARRPPRRIRSKKS